ncbi:trehalose-6-phosphate synthase, putative, partial [Perkinsus marinus ATCC 50983]
MDTILSFLRGAFLQQQHDGGGGHDAILKRIHYAASHGFDIKGPNDTHYQVGRAYLPQLYEARDRLIKEAQKYPHCVVEDNKFSISVHYRNVHPDLHVEVSDMVHSIVARYPHLRLHYGKMVYEIKLNLSWNKGKAVLWLLNAWGNTNNNN